MEAFLVQLLAHVCNFLKKRSSIAVVFLLIFWMFTEIQRKTETFTGGLEKTTSQVFSISRDPLNFSKVQRHFFDCFQHRFIHHSLSSFSFLSDDDPKTCEFNICNCDRRLASCLSKSKYNWKYWGYRFWPSNCESM